MTDYKNIYLKKGKEESLKRFHPWVFSGAINGMDEGINEGDIVRVLTHQGAFIAVGHYQIGSIAVRVLSFDDICIDDAYWHARLQSALDMRKNILIADNPDNNTFRLVHGEGDNLPGLVIDCYGKTAVMQAHSVGMHCCREAIARQLVSVMGNRIENVFYKSETTLPFKAELGQENGFIYGGCNDNIAVENGLKFQIIKNKTKLDPDEILETYGKEELKSQLSNTISFIPFSWINSKTLLRIFKSLTPISESLKVNLPYAFNSPSCHMEYPDVMLA